MIRIGKVRPQVMGLTRFAHVRRQHVCENGKWIWAVFEFRTWMERISDDVIRSNNAWVRVR